MGEYNPHVPIILGQEWVGIRDETLTFEPTINTSEQGHSFTLTAATQVSQARMYIDSIPVNGGNGSVAAVSVYPAGRAANSGPIRTVDIPLSSVIVTGDSPAAIATVSVNGASTALGALYAQGTDSSVRFAGTFSDFRWLSCLFDITRFAGLLQNKRILNIQLMYTANCTDNLIELDPQQNFGIPNSIFNTNVNWTPNTSPFASNSPFLGRIIAAPDTGYIADLGELNFHFSGQTPSANINTTPDRMNWNWAELVRMAGTGSPFIYVVLGMGGTITLSDSVFIYFVGLRITYCDEQRVLYGASAIGNHNNNTAGKVAVPGAFTITLRSATTMAANIVLPAGAYDVVVSSATQATPLQPVNVFPPINALRELYSMPAHTPVKTRIPFPLDNALGQVFDEQTTSILPQLSLHTTGSVIVNPHAYGRQAAAQVYGVNTAIQDIYDVPVGGAASFPQVRYYARRFGDTSHPLVLSTTSPTISGSTVSLTPGAFDALDTNIVDGWKDITLRFASPPTMGTGLIPRWMWSATGETSSSDRWEVMGVCAYAITGLPSNGLTLVASPQNPSTATYGTPISGNVVDLDWMPGKAPTVTGTTDDPSTDAVLIFSQDPTTITGLTITPSSMAVSGFTECFKAPCCTPTAIAYNRVSWSTPPPLNAFLLDTFSRVTVTGTWGTSDSGNTYTLDVGNTGAVYVNGTQGVIQPVVVTDDYVVYTNVGSPNQDIRGIVTIGDTFDATGNLRSGLLGRTTDGSNFYSLEIRYTPTGTFELRLRERVAGVQNDIIIITPTGFTPAAGVPYNMRFQLDGPSLRGKIWALGVDEPSDWMITTTDSSLTTGNNAGVFVRDDSSVGTTTFTFDNLTVGPPDYNFGSYELQRYDDIGAEWQTIMLATSPVITGFNDYEARVGVLSSYRVRQNNVLNFSGLWSVTGTGTVAEPGVTLPSCGASKRGVLIFTSNEVQDGSRNLAYAMTWDSDVVEDFDFNEAGTVDIQRHHDRDFQVAFHGSERGGETFSRRLLLANAAIALPRLGNTHALRDLAWDDLSYICVRDDIGDRWLAAVIVPRAEVRRKRRLYNADITVIEVTDTPTPVNP